MSAAPKSSTLPAPVVPPVKLGSTTADAAAEARTKQMKRRGALLKMTPNDMFMELVRDITNELNATLLCYKILVNMELLTKCERGSLFLRRGSADKTYLGLKLLNVTQTSELADSLSDEIDKVKVAYGSGIAGSVASTKQLINLPNVSKVKQHDQAGFYCF